LIGPIPGPWALRRLIIAGTADISPGQFIDVLIDTDNDPTDSATPGGTSIFEQIASTTGLPAPDEQRALPLILGPYDILDPYASELPGEYIRIHQYYTAPAAQLAQAHVLIFYDDLGPIVTAPPQPQPPPTYPAPTPTPTPTPPPTPTPTPPPPPTPTPPPTPLYFYTAHWDYRTPPAALIIIDEGTDPTIPDGTTYLWAGVSVPLRVLDAYANGRITWAPTIYSPPPYQPPFPTTY